MKVSLIISLCFIVFGLVFIGCGKDAPKPKLNPEPNVPNPDKIKPDVKKEFKNDWLTGEVDFELVPGLKDGGNLKEVKKILAIIKEFGPLPSSNIRQKHQDIIDKIVKDPTKYCEAFIELVKIKAKVTNPIILNNLDKPLYNWQFMFFEASLKYLFPPAGKYSHPEKSILYKKGIELIEKGEIKQALASIKFSDSNDGGFPKAFLYPRQEDLNLKKLEENVEKLQKHFEKEIFPLFKTVFIVPILKKLYETKLTELFEAKKYSEMFINPEKLPTEFAELFADFTVEKTSQQTVDAIKKQIEKYNKKFPLVKIKALYTAKFNVVFDIYDANFYKPIKHTTEQLDEIEKKITTIKEEVEAWGLSKFAPEKEAQIMRKISEMMTNIKTKREKLKKENK